MEVKPDIEPLNRPCVDGKKHTFVECSNKGTEYVVIFCIYCGEDKLIWTQPKKRLPKDS